MKPTALLSSPLAPLLLRPAYDRLAVVALARLFFPVSRAWAAALAAEGDPGRFHAALPQIPDDSRAARRTLARTRARKAAYEDAAADWEAGFFGGEGEAAALAGLERRRLYAANALMRARFAFAGLHLRYRLPAVRFEIADPEAVRARHGQRLAAPEGAFAVPDPPPAFERSRSIPGPAPASWIRCPVTAGGGPDTLWARIDEPPGGTATGTLIFTHGICMENEFWGGIGDPPAVVPALGLRIVRPEGPYHGRRRVGGTYGGEPVIALGPLGLLDYLAAHVAELGLLAAWARRNAPGPVAVGGVSLGALAAQLYASVAGSLPRAMRADAIFLVTPSASLIPVATAGSLPRAIGVPEALAAAGWDGRELDRWRPLLDPKARADVPAGRIVAVLGTRDDVTPYAEGRRLVRSWGLASDNVFIRRRGHFTASLGLYRDGEPFRRLARVMGAA